jgi:thiamine biosynthesis protein ThiI
MQSTTSSDTGVIVLRVAEIFLKGGNRRAFFKTFVRNAKRLVSDLDGVRVVPMYLRVVIEHPVALREACLERLVRLFGMSSMSPAVSVASDLDALSEAAIEAARALPPGTFKVESKRRDKRFRLNSQQISQHVGGRVFEATERPVDVRNPDHVVRVEVDEDQSYVYARVVRGPGGLPVGTGGNVSLLLSGGIDSPVAGWSLMRRGCNLNAIYFHSFPYTGDKTKEKVLDLARILAKWQGRLAVNVVHFTEVQKTLRSHGRADFAVLLYRRMMMRTASLIASRERSAALVTGENVGQVASQTIQNIAVIEAAATMPILRPLVAYDKLEIIAKAEDIGTYETSILPYDDCCSLFVPKHPATRARIHDLEGSEQGLDVEAMAAELADGTERIVVDG